MTANALADSIAARTSMERGPTQTSTTGSTTRTGPLLGRALAIGLLLAAPLLRAGPLPAPLDLDPAFAGDVTKARSAAG